MEWKFDGDVQWLEAEMPGARAAFTTRLGGISEGDFASLNLGILTDDDRVSVLENRARLCGALGFSEGSMLTARQIHEAAVLTHTAPQEPSPFAVPGSPTPDADGHATRAAGLAPLVFVADCLPIALRGPGGVAMVHGGWRGLAGGIIERGAELVGATHAAIGPGINQCCFEVGEEVLEAFAFLGEDLVDGWMLDLPGVAERLLGRAGVTSVESARLCTSCSPELFFSHRRDKGRTGRQAGVAWIDGEGPWRT